MFKGHQFVKLTSEKWVFDLTEFLGYKVKFDRKGNICGYTEAFQVLLIGDEIVFERFIDVPLKILRETLEIVEEHKED